MKKVGRQVQFIPATQNISRIGEGSFIRLNNDHILFGYTEFNSCGREDEDIAQIVAVISCDDGESWSEKLVLFEKPEDAVNIMCLSFLRMANGDIGAFYITKNADGSDDIMLSRSKDEGKSWSEPASCISDILGRNYYILNNDRVTRTSSGRIILPLACHPVQADADYFPPGHLVFVYSDDDGKTWQKSESVLECPFPSDKNGFQEPGIYEKENGTLWCYIRTGMGFQFECFSADDGKSFSVTQPNIFFSSPC